VNSHWTVEDRRSRFHDQENKQCTSKIYKTKTTPLFLDLDPDLKNLYSISIICATQPYKPRILVSGENKCNA